EWGYREDEPLNGYDPYSNSKSCSELVTDSYKNSFLKEQGIAVSTARAGNVIGGGDFTADRIIPDCMRAIRMGEKICVRNPFSTRPYQHVLEPVMAYLMIAKKQYEDASFAGNYNVGPNDSDCLETGEIVNRLCTKWNIANQADASWYVKGDGGPHEANYLKLDCSRIRAKFDWKPKWNLDETLDRIVEWYVIYQKGEDVSSCMQIQIEQYLEEKQDV
ncbi:MAG: CDP-glucose 4,6-dehydratase, partial [Clostridia bacterium]|nr:CDP-glucose 4,6-dehydratase [Clostridia bacterium]